VICREFCSFSKDAKRAKKIDEEAMEL